MVDTASEKKFLHLFHVGMTCSGCSNAIDKLLSSEKSYVDSYEISLEDKTLKVVGKDGIEQQVLARLTKWATASKKELEFVSKTEIQ
jgi:copper chaperone CopZ